MSFFLDRNPLFFRGDTGDKGDCKGERTFRVGPGEETGVTGSYVDWCLSPLSHLPVSSQTRDGAVANDVGIDCGAFSGGVKVSAQAARSIAVGTPITERPPHRSERAQFGHSAPTLGV